MAEGELRFQLVTFQLGEELYGVDIMDVKEVVKIQNVRPIPNAPYYVEGIFNLRFVKHGIMRALSWSGVVFGV